MPAKAQKKSPGNFFGVDRQTWGRVCDSASINEAVGYLVLAQGTGADNRCTNWSATAMKRYAGISWERAKMALLGLDEKQFLRLGEHASKSKPCYELLSYAEVAQAQFARGKANLTSNERLLLDEIRKGRERRKRGRTNSDHVRLSELGMIREDGTGEYVALDDPPLSGDPDLIWLPNALVTGTERGENSPVHRLRSEGDIWSLRLLVDLYHAHNLRDDGGISPGVLQQSYTRMQVGEQGVFNVWAFKADTPTLWFKGPLKTHQFRPKEPNGNHPAWGSIGHLQRQGLITFVPHLWDNKCDGSHSEAEVIHSYGIGQSGEPLEVQIGSAAHQAGAAMVPEFKREKAFETGHYHFAPVPKSLPNVQMIGVARLRYRPHTRRTSDWYGDLMSNAPGWVERYQDLREKAQNGVQKTA